MSTFSTYTLISKTRVVTAGNLMSSPVYVDLDVSDDLVDLTGVEELTVIALTEGISAQFRWNVYFMSGYTRSTEAGSGPYTIGTVGSANGSTRSSAYSTVANFLPTSRFMIGYGNNSGALQESAILSAMLCVKRIG